MLDNSLNFISICTAFNEYAQEPEREGITRALKKQFNQPTVAKVLTIVNEFINEQDINNEQSKDLTKLYKNIQVLVEKESECLKKGSSILHKNYWITDFFRSLFNWKYSRQKEIYEVRNQLNELQYSLYNKCMLVRKKEQAPLISQRLKKYNITEKNFSDRKEEFISLIKKSNKGWPIFFGKKKWLDADFIQLFHQPDFQALFKSHIEEFQATIYDKSHLVLLHTIYLQARENFIKSIGKTLGGDEAIQIMVLVILNLPLSFSLLKLETEITPEDTRNNLQRTLSEFEVAVMYIVNPNSSKIRESYFQPAKFIKSCVTTIRQSLKPGEKISK